MSSATSLRQFPSDNHRLNYGDDSFFDIDYFQDEDTDNYRAILKDCPSSHPDTFHIRLQVHHVIRRHISAEADDEPVFEDGHVEPVTEHYIPLISAHELCPNELQRFIDATSVPEQVLPSFKETLWSFMRKVVPVARKNRKVVLRPFSMIITIVGVELYDDQNNNLVESSESLPKYELYEDCFEKVRFDQDGICSEKTTEQSCSICFGGFKVGMDLRRLPCSHVYHGDCIVKWVCSKPTCPLCRFVLI